MFDYHEDCVPRPEPLAHWEIGLGIFVGTVVPCLVMAALIPDLGPYMIGYVIGALVTYVLMGFGRRL